MLLVAIRIFQHTATRDCEMAATDITLTEDQSFPSTSVSRSEAALKDGFSIASNGAFLLVNVWCGCL